MARGINKVFLIGNLGTDPEVRYTPDGQCIANVTVATSEEWLSDGQKQSRTEWHKVVFYKRLAEIVEQYLKKGSKIYVEGKLRTSKWQDKASGQDRYKTEVIGESMQMLDSKNSTDSQPQAVKTFDNDPLPF